MCQRAVLQRPNSSVAATKHTTLLQQRTILLKSKPFYLLRARRPTSLLLSQVGQIPCFVACHIRHLQTPDVKQSLHISLGSSLCLSICLNSEKLPLRLQKAEDMYHYELTGASCGRESHQ